MTNNHFMQPSDIKKLSQEQRNLITKEELHDIYGVRRVDCTQVMVGIRRYETLSDESKRDQEKADALGWKLCTVHNYRSILRKYGFIEGKYEAGS